MLGQIACTAASETRLPVFMVDRSLSGRSTGRPRWRRNGGRLQHVARCEAGGIRHEAVGFGGGPRPGPHPAGGPLMRRGPLVVVGDCLLDVDLVGSATRLSPDAPVPVVDVTERWERPGGAGLAALLAARTEVEVVLVTALGEDDAALTLGALLAQHVDVCRLRLDGDTVVKTRIAASGVPMLRLDTGDGRAADAPLPRSITAVLATAGALLGSDYGRGGTAPPAPRRRLGGGAAGGARVLGPPPPRAPPPAAAAP